MTEKSKEVALFGQKDSMPAHLQGAGPSASEGLTQEDVAIPRIKLIQKMSPEHDEGVPVGVFLNSISGEQLDAPYVVNLHFNKEFAVFKDRKLGNEFQGTFDTREEAEAHKNSLDRPEDYNVSETARHVLLLLNEKGEPQSPAIYNMSGTALQVSRMWNSQILTRCKECPRYGAVWQLRTKDMKNNKGSWKVPDPTFVGYASEELFAEVEKYYEQSKAAA